MDDYKDLMRSILKLLENRTDNKTVSRVLIGSGESSGPSETRGYVAPGRGPAVREDAAIDCKPRWVRLDLACVACWPLDLRFAVDLMCELPETRLRRALGAHMNQKDESGFVASI